MGRYTPTVKFTTEFDGDQVEVELRRMRSDQSMRLAPFLRPRADGNGIEPLTMDDKIGLFRESIPILKECIVSISGSKQADGTENDVETILSQEYFGPLVSKIMEKLMEASRVPSSGDDAKKSDAPSAASSLAGNLKSAASAG